MTSDRPPERLPGVPDPAANGRYEWLDAQRHMQGLMLQARYVASDIEPIHNMNQWIRNCFDSQGGLEAMKYVRGFISEDIVEGWRAFLKSRTGAGWGAGWIVHARTARKKAILNGQEADAKRKRVSERADVAMTPPRVKALAEPIAKPLPDEARDAAWKALPPAERKALREDARGQGQFRLSWGIGERIAKDKWCTKQRFGKGD